MRVDKAKVKREKSDYAVQAVNNAIGILELLGEHEHELSVSEIVSSLSLTKSNANKLLANLERYGYAERNPCTDNYRLGVRTFQISQSYINKLNLVEVSLQEMQQLKKNLDESVYVGVLHKDCVIYLAVAETDKPVRVRPRIGNTGAAYATAMGKAQLAGLSDDDIDALYKSKEFTLFTSHTVRSLKELKNQLAAVRDNGYAVDFEEYEDGVCCIASPIFNFMGKIIAGISVSAPMERVSKEYVVNAIAPVLKETAGKLSAKFGFSA